MSTTTRISATHAPTEQASLRSLFWLCAIFAVLKLAIHIIGNVLAQQAGYGIFRDELYYLVCGRHLAFGYVDQPPMVALQARLSEMLFGHEHMWSLRLLSGLAGAVKVFLTGLLVWALGGGRRAAALAMLGVLVAGVFLGIDGFLSMNSFEPVFWMTCVLALARIVQAQDERIIRNWWIVLGVSAGLGLENKISELFFLIAVLVALLLTPQRRILKSRWFGVAVLLIAAIALPHLLWQVKYHFPTLEWLADVKKSGKDIVLPPLKFFLAQIFMLTPWTALLWLSGFFWLLLSKAARPFRFLGVTYLLFLPLMMALHAKDYYLAPIYPLLFAAGAVAWISWARNKIWHMTLVSGYALLLIVGFFLTVPFSIPVLRPQPFLAWAKTMHFQATDAEVHDATPLPQFFADRFGWQDMVDKVARIYNSLPQEERAITGIYVGNYGEASAMNILGERYGLPTAISGHQNYWLWGPRGYTGEEMIILYGGAKASDLKPYYASCTLEDKMDHPYAMPWEHGGIFLCRGRKTTYAADWKDLKNYH